MDISTLAFISFSTSPSSPSRMTLLIISARSEALWKGKEMAVLSLILLDGNVYQGFSTGYSYHSSGGAKIHQEKVPEVANNYQTPSASYFQRKQLSLNIFLPILAQDLAAGRGRMGCEAMKFYAWQLKWPLNMLSL